MTFVTTYALILPAITVEKEHTDKVAGMYLEQEGTQDDLLEENALEFTGVSIAADQENAVTYEYADDDMTAVAVFSTEEEIPEGAELVVNPVDTESEKYTEFSNRAALLLDSEFIYDVTTCSFYDFALICDGVDVTPKTGLVDVQINFLSNTVSHAEDVVYAGRFGRAAEAEDSFVAMAADITGETADTLAGSAEDELVSANPDESSVIELTDGIITILSLKGNDLAQNDSIVGVLAGYVDEEAKAAAAETDAEVPTVDDIQEETSALEIKTLKAAGEDYTVTLTYDETSGIPDGASLVVSEIAQNTKEYKTYLEKTKKAMGLTEEETLPKCAARFFDIKIMAGNKEFKPESGVSVEITYTEPLAENPETEVSAVHFENKKAKAEVIEANASGVQEDGAATVEFTAESFSVYGVIYTVDFHWEVNGKTYDFSIPGGGFVSFEHLAEVLNLAASETDDETAGSLADTANGPEEAASITDEAIRLNEVAVSDRTKQFTACVQDIEFSNPLLADVCKVDTDTTVGQIKADRALEVEYSADLTKEQIDAINAQVIEGGDWVLISEHPFDTEETLTVTMKTGEVFVIKVTDSNFASTVDGKTFALIIANNAKTSGYALDVNVRSDGRFTSRQTNINYLGETVNEEVYFCDNVNSIKWTFEYIKGSGNQFKLKANNGQYLHYENGRFSLSNEPTILYADVTPGDNDHVRLCMDEGLHNAINLYGGNNGFGIWGNGSNDPNEKFTLCEPFDMSTNTPGTITTVDNNAEGIELKLFDYDYIATPGTTGDLDKEENRIYGDTLGSSYNTSVNTGKKFWFLGWGSSSNETAPGINDFTGLGDNIRALQGIVKNNLVGGYPELAVDQNGNATNDSLAYLFDGTANDTKSYTANHLFEKIGDKYSYDSNKHYAEFNKTTGNFTVYDGTLEQNSGADKQYAKNDKAVGFFPFDSYSDMKGLYDNNRLYLNPNISENDQRKSNGQHYRMNHHNGMSLDAHFRMPEAGKDSYGNDIEFEFSGDDDLWVYIDDVLVLDIGGVHQPLNGKINFTTGEVTVDAAVETDGVSSSAIAGASTTIEEMFRKAGKTYDPHKLHEMKVFWIERGGCDSNCKIEFNLPLTTTKEAGAVTFDKVSALNQSLKLEGAVFTLYTDPACTTPLLIGNVPVTATSGEDGVVNFYAIPTGDYYVKETTFPEGYAAKDPEEIFTVHVAKDTTSRPLINGAEVNPVTNEPKKISVDVEKVWENGIIPDGAAIEIVLGRYRLVEDPNAQGKGTLVIRDSYTGLPTGSNYNVTYTITGPDNYSNTIRKSYADTSKDIEISVPNLPAGVQYTVTKTVVGISHYNTNNGSGTQTAIVPKKGSVDVRFSQSTFTRNAYKVTIYSLDKKVNVNTWVAAKYYPANSSLYLQGSYKNDYWARGRRFQYSFDNSTFKDFQIENNGQWNQTGRTEQFTLNQDIDIYIRTQESDNDANSWTKDYDWFVNPTINGANPVSTNSAGRMMMASPARAAANVLSQTAPAPTLPVPPKDTVYELDAEYAADPGKITLSGNTWTGSIGDLYADNEYGPYVYYIAQVNETGMPEGTQITIADEISLDGSANVLTVTNNVPTGSLEITKTIQKNGTTDTSAAGTFYYAVYSEAYDPDASPAQTPVRTGSITVSSNGTQTVTETGLYYGSYYVYELTGAGGTPIVSGSDGTHQTIGGTVYKVTGSGSSATIGASSQTASAALNNNKETVSKTATKSWSDSNPDNLTIYFKLFYEANNGVDADGYPNIEDIEVAGAGVKELASGTTSVTWDDLPKYDGSGNEYVYLVKEYVMKDGSLAAAAPDGYVKTEDGLSVTNSRSEGYDPKTEYTGTKIWVDTANNGATRPETLRVTLYANGEPTNYTAQWTKGTGEKANEWTYTFSDLPVFDQNGSYIQYAVSEAEISGYDPDDPGVTPTAYQQLESLVPARVTTNSSLDITLDKETDLAYIAIKKNANSHLIWTQRAITAAEKQKLYEDINKTEGFIGEMNDSTVEFVSGLPIEKLFQKGTVTVTKTNNTTMHVTFVRENQWAQVCYGSYRYEYAPGTTSFTNRLHTVTVDAAKAWQDFSGTTMTPAAGTTATFDLYINGIAQNRQIVLNGKTDVASEEDLSEDETEQAKQEVNAEAIAANAYESEPWKAFWCDLAEYDAAGKPIVYTVKEVSASEGFANQNTEGVSSGETITNKQTEMTINVLKVDGRDGTTPLAGAKFKLRRYTNDKYQECEKEWPEQEVSSEPATKGTLTFTNISVGYYELEESEPPEGYVKTGSNPRFTVTEDEDGNLQVTFTNTDMVTYENGEFKVENEPGAALPSTGGSGTAPFTIPGSLMLLGAGVLLWRRRRLV